MTQTIVRDDGILLVTAIGDLGLTEMLNLQADASREWVAQTTRAVLYDLRFTTIRMRPEESDLFYTASTRWGFTKCSTNAVVAPSRSFDQFLAQAARFAAHGVCHAIFTDFDLAWRWALEHEMPVKPRKVVRR